MSSFHVLLLDHIKLSYYVKWLDCSNNHEKLEHISYKDFSDLTCSSRTPSLSLSGLFPACLGAARDSGNPRSVRNVVAVGEVDFAVMRQVIFGQSHQL